METKKIISVFDAQKALRNSNLKYAKAMANYKPDLVKVKSGNSFQFYFYWKDRNYAYNPENGLCGYSEMKVGNLSCQPVQVGDSNAHVLIVDSKYGLAVELK